MSVRRVSVIIVILAGVALAGTRSVSSQSACIPGVDVMFLVESSKRMIPAVDAVKESVSYAGRLLSDDALYQHPGNRNRLGMINFAAPNDLYTGVSLSTSAFGPYTKGGFVTSDALAVQSLNLSGLNTAIDNFKPLSLINSAGVADAADEAQSIMGNQKQPGCNQVIFIIMAGGVIFPNGGPGDGVEQTTLNTLDKFMNGNRRAVHVLLTSGTNIDLQPWSQRPTGLEGNQILTQGPERLTQQVATLLRTSAWPDTFVTTFAGSSGDFTMPPYVSSALFLAFGDKSTGVDNFSVSGPVPVENLERQNGHYGASVLVRDPSPGVYHLDSGQNISIVLRMAVGNLSIDGNAQWGVSTLTYEMHDTFGNTLNYPAGTVFPPAYVQLTRADKTWDVPLIVGKESGLQSATFVPPYNGIYKPLVVVDTHSPSLQQVPVIPTENLQDLVLEAQPVQLVLSGDTAQLLMSHPVNLEVNVANGEALATTPIFTMVGDHPEAVSGSYPTFVAVSSTSYTANMRFVSPLGEVNNQPFVVRVRVDFKVNGQTDTYSLLPDDIAQNPLTITVNRPTLGLNVPDNALMLSAVPVTLSSGGTLTDEALTATHSVVCLAFQAPDGSPQDIKPINLTVGKLVYQPYVAGSYTVTIQLRSPDCTSPKSKDIVVYRASAFSVVAPSVKVMVADNKSILVVQDITISSETSDFNTQLLQNAGAVLCTQIKRTSTDSTQVSLPAEPDVLSTNTLPFTYSFLPYAIGAHDIQLSLHQSSCTGVLLHTFDVVRFNTVRPTLTLSVGSDGPQLVQRTFSVTSNDITPADLAASSMHLCVDAVPLNSDQSPISDREQIVGLADDTFNANMIPYVPGPYQTTLTLRTDCTNKATTLAVLNAESPGKFNAQPVYLGFISKHTTLDLPELYQFLPKELSLGWFVQVNGTVDRLPQVPSVLPDLPLISVINGDTQIISQLTLNGDVYSLGLAAPQLTDPVDLRLQADVKAGNISIPLYLPDGTTGQTAKISVVAAQLTVSVTPQTMARQFERAEVSVMLNSTDPDDPSGAYTASNFTSANGAAYAMISVTGGKWRVPLTADSKDPARLIATVPLPLGGDYSFGAELWITKDYRPIAASNPARLVREAVDNEVNRLSVSPVALKIMDQQPSTVESEAHVTFTIAWQANNSNIIDKIDALPSVQVSVLRNSDGGALFAPQVLNRNVDGLYVFTWNTTKVPNGDYTVHLTWQSQAPPDVPDSSIGQPASAQIYTQQNAVQYDIRVQPVVVYQLALNGQGDEYYYVPFLGIVHTAVRENPEVELDVLLVAVPGTPDNNCVVNKLVDYSCALNLTDPSKLRLQVTDVAAGREIPLDQLHVTWEDIPRPGGVAAIRLKIGNVAQGEPLNITVSIPETDSDKPGYRLQRSNSGETAAQTQVKLLQDPLTVEIPTRWAVYTLGSGTLIFLLLLALAFIVSRYPPHLPPGILILADELGKEAWNDDLKRFPNRNRVEFLSGKGFGNVNVERLVVKSVPNQPKQVEVTVWLKGKTSFVGRWFHRAFRHWKFLPGTPQGKPLRLTLDEANAQEVTGSDRARMRFVTTIKAIPEPSSVKAEPESNPTESPVYIRKLETTKNEGTDTNR